MKIVTDSQSATKACYIQQKDLLYLGQKLGDTSLITLYEENRASSIADNTFLYIKDIDLISLIICDTELINFVDYAHTPTGIIAIDILSKLSSLLEIQERATTKNAIRDLRDIIAYRNGSLPYTIPPVPTDQYVMDYKNLTFSSTIFDDVYLLRTINGEDINSYDYLSYLTNCLAFIYKNAYPIYLSSELSYTITKYNNSLLITIKPKVKKNIIKKYRAKMKTLKEDLSMLDDFKK